MALRDNIVVLQPLPPVTAAGFPVPSYQDYSNNLFLIQEALNSLIQNNNQSAQRVKNFISPAQVAFRIAGRF